MNKLTGKYLWILVGVVVVVGVYLTRMRGDWTSQVSQYVGIVTASPSPSSVAGATVKPVAKKSVATPPVSAKSYGDAVKEYEGRRIQFDERCQVTPQNPTYKNGTIVMLDNRSASAKTVMVGGTKYDLGAYGYRIVTLSSPSLPKELTVSCGSSGNVGKILLQAQILQ